MSMKPILFNTEMVRAIQDGTKTVTRRVVKPRYCDSVFEMFGGELCETSPYKPPIDNGDGTTTRFVRHCVPCKPPYRPDDILYVREAWAAWSRTYGTAPVLYYKADGNAPDGIKWRPSIHMPREAARIFLRVTDVRVERLQAPFSAQLSPIFALQREGIDIGEQCRECIENYGEPCCVDTVDEDGTDKYGGECGMLDEVRGDFSDLWDAAIKPADRALYGWAANPWVWVIEFERCERPKE